MPVINYVTLRRKLTDCDAGRQIMNDGIAVINWHGFCIMLRAATSPLEDKSMEHVTFTVDCGFVYFACGMWIVRDKDYQYLGMFDTEETARVYALKLAIKQLDEKDYI